MVDFVIVGGGSAGCVLANRLSADPSVEVVLLEAGREDKSPFIHMPAGYFRLMNTGTVDWNYHTVPQEHMKSRVMFWPRGKVLGGSSSVNGMVYIRGHASDYDRWAQMGNRGWSYDECVGYFKKAERWEGGETEIHGGSGPLRTSRYGARHPFAKAFLEAGVQAGYPHSGDLNDGHPEGFACIDSTLHDGRRMSAAVAYLKPVKDRRNLRIVTGALATKVLIEKGRAVGVQFIKNGKVNTLHAEREVLLSGGAINSPQLLQLSGVGEPNLLRKHGITVTRELKGVGENLQDHLALGVKQRSSSPISLLPYVHPVRSAIAFVQYMLSRKGPAAYHGIEVGAYIKSLKQLIAPDLQYHLMMILYTDHGRNIIQEHGFMPVYNIARPESLGSVRITSSDPGKHPAIDPNYMATEEDVRVMREGIKIGRDIISQKAFDPYRGEEWGPGKSVRTDAEIDDYVRANAESLYHPVGTCKMGPEADAGAVVDDRLKVHGIERLRVVDASIMPNIVTGNTNAPTMMIAERASDWILGTVQAKPTTKYQSSSAFA